MIDEEIKKDFISVAVCDDEILMCLDIEKKVANIFYKNGINYETKAFYSGRELIASKEKYDIILLDIKMDKLNGIETAKILRENKCSSILIFITVDPEFVYKAFDVNAFHYILKPVDDENLESILKRAAKKVLLSKEKEDFIVVSQNRQLMKLLLSDIMYFETKKRVIKAHLLNSTYEFYEKLSSLEEKMNNNKFFRCHKSYLVNLSYVEKVEKSELTLQNGEKIPLSKRRYEEFSKAFFDFMKREGGII